MLTKVAGPRLEASPPPKKKQKTPAIHQATFWAENQKTDVAF